MKRFIYGPIKSRRLGNSLGVNIFPSKICSFDCVYCECMKSSDIIIERKEFYPPEEIIKEINDFLAETKEPVDYVTFSGSGEPTLHSGLGTIIRGIKSAFPDVKVAVLTNSSLLYQEDVRNDLMDADLVSPSLDAVTEEAFVAIDRPHEKITVDMVVNGLKEFTKAFKAKDADKQIWVEVFLIEGINTDKAHTSKLINVLKELEIDRVQLNSLDRTGTEEWVEAVSYQTMEEIKKDIESSGIKAVIEIIKKNIRL